MVNIWRDLNDAEEMEFRQWARDNYKKGEAVNETWHPIVKDECHKINYPASKLLKEIKFAGIDSWNRIVFHTLDKSEYYGSVTTLYPDSKKFPKNTIFDILNYFRHNLSELEYFGTKFDCEPHGGLVDNIEFKILD